MTVTLIDFYAEWCGPCKQQTPIVEELEQEYDEDEHDRDVEFSKVDVDEEEELADEFGVRSLPTLVVLKEEDADGEVTEEIYERFVGLTQKEALDTAVSGALD